MVMTLALTVHVAVEDEVYAVLEEQGLVRLAHALVLLQIWGK